MADICQFDVDVLISWHCIVNYDACVFFIVGQADCEADACQSGWESSRESWHGHP